MPEPSLLQRLKERKLVQWAVAYLAGAWVLVEATNLVVDQFSWPQVAGQVVTILAFFGFFVVLVVAWYHGEKGRQWVSGPELLIIALLLLISGGVLSTLGHGEDSPGSVDAPASAPEQTEGASVAVLPCANMSADPGDEYLASGFHDEILLKLQGISSLLSIGRTSVLQYAENPPGTEVIAAALGVKFIGECSVRKYGEKIRLIFQLLNGGTGVQVWAADFDRDLTLGNLLDIQSEVAQQVAVHIGAEVTPHELERIEARPTESREAYDAYLLGRFLNSRPGTENSRRAIGLLKEAIELDPGFSQAHVELGYAYRMLGWYTVTLDPAPLADSAQMNLERAVQLDDQNAEAFAQLSIFLLVWRWDLTGAEAAMLRALSLDPNSLSSALGMRTSCYIREGWS